MISIKNQLPNIYYDASRDFQILGHLFEVVLNYTKTNADMLYLLPNGITSDTRATELLAHTLGFKLKRNYDKEQLAALVSIFPRLLKMKGTLQAVNLAGNALVKASGVPGTFESELTDRILTVKIPQELSDITLFLDLLPYILPFGVRVSVVRTTIIRHTYTTPLGTNSVIRNVLIGGTIYEPRPVGLHPLGLAKIELSEGTEIVSANTNSSIIVTEGEGATQTAAIGLLATSPIITIEPEIVNNGTTVVQAEEEII